MKRSLLLLMTVIFCLVLIGCQNNNEENGASNASNSNSQTEENAGENNVTDSPNSSVIEDYDGPKPTVTITMENDGVIEIELYPHVAENTVNNFLSLAQDGFYDGLIFHRVIPGFMIQGGDPAGNGTGGPGYSIKGEFAKNDVENPLIHERGVISMARSQHPDSAGSQFFIMHADSPHLDGEYASFGKVTSGMEVVDEIAATETEGQDRPVTDQVIKKVEVDLKDYDFKEPEVQ